MTTKNRLARIEKQKPQVTREPVKILSDEMHARSMDSLAAALSTMTGEPMTGADAAELIRELSNDNKK